MSKPLVGAVVQALIVGIAFVLISLVGFQSPTPRNASITVVGTTEQAAHAQSVLDSTLVGQYKLTVVPDVDAGIASVKSGAAIASIDVSQSVIYYGSANGPTVTSHLLAALPLALNGAVQPHNKDVVPLERNDTGGLPMFYLVFGVVLASFLFAVSSFSNTLLSGRKRLIGAASLAVFLGVASTIIAIFATSIIPLSSALRSLSLLMLVSMAVSSGAFLVMRWAGRFGSTAATILMVVLGSSSGGVVHPDFLPAWLAFFRPLLPMGIALDGLRDLVYFGDLTPLLAPAGLLTWAAIPIVIAVATSRIQPREAKSA